MEDQLTRDYIENMPAGREMDALVAQLVIKFPPLDDLVSTHTFEVFDFCWEECDETGRRIRRHVIPHYSTNISAAWEAIEALQPRGLVFVLWTGPTISQVYRDGTDEDNLVDVKAETMPLAICRAALLAVME